MTHHAIELAKREPTIAAFAVNPGVAFLPYTLPQWLVRFPFPQWILKRLPSVWKHIHDACTTNEAGLARCPEIFDNSAAVIAAAAAWPNIESYSGSYLDFDTEALPPDAPQVYGPFVQHEPSCQPREAPSMDARLRSAWYDEMPKLMRSLPAEEPSAAGAAEPGRTRAPNSAIPRPSCPHGPPENCAKIDFCDDCGNCPLAPCYCAECLQGFKKHSSGCGTVADSCVSASQLFV